jgi:hypothetical protein
MCQIMTLIKYNDSELLGIYELTTVLSDNVLSGFFNGFIQTL